MRACVSERDSKRERRDGETEKDRGEKEFVYFCPYKFTT
jgi:hypothetical protein